MDTKISQINPGERGRLSDLIKHFGVEASYDELLNAPSIKGVPGGGNDMEGLIAYSKSVCRAYEISRTIVDEQLESIVKGNVINPVRDWLSGIERSKTNNPVHELVDNLPVEDKEWVKVALYRWLIQCCAAADMSKHEGKHPNSVYKYENVLVLGGDNGLHKSSFIKYLLPTELHKYIRESAQFDAKDSDSMLNILRCWIPEIVDLGPALKGKGLPALKVFLAKEVDEIRLTYSRTSTIMRRHVSCMASVEGEYPPKGTKWDRRFLPVIAKDSLDYPRVANFDYTDLWAFIWREYTHGVPWWLTSKEEVLRTEILGHPDNRSLKDIVLEVFDFEDASSSRVMKMTSTEILNELPDCIITNRANQIALKQVLKGLGVLHKRRDYYMPPLSKDESSKINPLDSEVFYF